MENTTFYNRANMIQAIESHGFIVEFLPSYSPDVNLIEQRWIESKPTRRETQCSVDKFFLNYTSLYYSAI